MRKVNVFLRTGKNPHPIYYDLIDYPPSNINYKHPGIIKATSNKKSSTLHKLKIKIWLKYIKKNPAIAWIDKKGCDIIHSTNNIMVLNRSPWVMDVENLWGLINFDPNNLKKSYFLKVRNILSSKYCKKLIHYTNAAKLSLIYSGLGRLEDKMEVVYPAKKSIPYFNKMENKIPRILWAGSKFWEKGGNTVLQVFDKINKKAKFELIMLGPVPESIKKRYSTNKNITFIENKRHDKILWEEFQKADIFFYPTNLDSYGLGMIDAMNYCLPIVASKIFSSSEIVENGVNGFIIEHPFKWHDEKFQIIFPSFEDYVEKLKYFRDEKFINEFSKNILKLLKDKNLRKSMGIAGKKMVENGKFSIEERNKKLEKIYNNALF